MSMTKRWMEQDAAENLALEKSRCGCRYNWDDKFEELCETHQRDADEDNREYHWSIVEQNYGK